MENQVFNLEDVNDKAVEMPYELLSQSIRHEGKYGNTLETKPVQIWNLISDIQEMADKANLNGHLEKIYVQKKSSAALLNDADRNAGYNKYNAPINRWKFDKVLASINFPNISTPGRNAKIGITLNEQGLVVAYGMDVHVCQNFSVLGGTILRTYSFARSAGLAWDHMKTSLRSWTNNLEQLYSLQSGIVNDMEAKEIKDERTIQKIIGILYQSAINQAYFKGDYTPFDTHALSQFVQTMLRERKDEEKIGNVWDLYNWGTSIMKPGVIDVAEICNVSDSYAKFLCKEFTIDIPTIEVE